MLGSHASVVAAVAANEIELGATYVHLADGVTDAAQSYVSSGWTDASCGVPMRVLLTSRIIPPDAICATTAVGMGLEVRIRKAFESMHERSEGSRTLAGLFQAVRFEPVDPQDYDVVRAALNVTKSRRFVRPRR